MSKHIEEIQAAIDSHMQELAEEAKEISEALDQLESAVASLKGNAKSKAATKPRAKKRSYNKKGGTRAEQAVKIIRAKPILGQSPGEIAKAMKIKRNYLYRLLPELVKAGKLKKEGKRYYPAS